jgi:DNA-binding transcriptional LysR family regulator
LHQLIGQVDHMSVELRQMQYFVVVAEQLSFRRAAERLYISQPTLSHQIAKLERMLGLRLLDRDRRHVALTDAGAAFLERARELLFQADQAVARARWTAGLAGSGLRVGRAPGDGRSAGRLLDACRQEYPDVWLDERVLASPAQVAALHEGTLDVGLVDLPLDASGDGLAVEPVPSKELILAIPDGHRLAQLEEVPLRELAGERFVMPPHRSCSRHYGYVSALCVAAGFKPEIVWLERSEPYDLRALLLMVAIGRGVTLLNMPGPRPAPAGVAFRPLRLPHPARRLAAASRREDPSPVVLAFLKVARGLTSEVELAEP